MVKIALSKGSACEVTTKSSTFLVFPDKPEGKARMLVSHPMEEFSQNIVCWPGEYDFDEMFIRGIGQEDGKQISFVCDAEGMRIAFVDEPVLPWSDADLERLGDTGILVVRADEAKAVKALVESVDPRVLVLIAGEKADIGAIAKACGSADPETVSEVKLQSSSLPTDTRKTIILS